MSFDGKEKLYEPGVDEAWPYLILREAGPEAEGLDGVIAIPERLVKRLRDARAAEREAVNEIARWVKYGDDAVAKAAILEVIQELPTADERKAARKR